MSDETEAQDTVVYSQPGAAARAQTDHAETLLVGPPSAATHGRSVLSGLTVSEAEAGAGEVERYRTLSRLGAGGMGDVELVKDEDIGREVALKRLKPHLRSNPEVLRRFVDEIRTIGQLEHPNIVPIHDVGQADDGSLYFVMKRVEGETLADVIGRLKAREPEAHARWPWRERARVVIKLLEALELAHERGVIHRDIKPSNVMVGAHGQVLLMDWGLARTGDTEPTSEAGQPDGEQDPLATRAGAVLGTPAYMAPEQAAGRNDQVDQRSDLYAVGLLLFELMTLQHPLHPLPASVPEVLAAAQAQPIPFAFLVRSPHQPPLPAEYAHLIRRALQREPDRRWPSARDLRLALVDLVDGNVCAQCPVTAVKSATHQATRLLDRFPVVGVLLLLVLAPLFLGLAGFGAYQLLNP